MCKKELITAIKLREILKYTPETGVFIWKVSASNCIKSGDVAGTQINGYCYIRVLGRKYAAHRLAWLYVYGEWPIQQIDHINRNRSDNRICNLRTATVAENAQNTSLPDRNTSGHKGVSWNKSVQKWRAYIEHQRKQIHIGYFSDINKAVSARVEAELIFHPFSANSYCRD